MFKSLRMRLISSYALITLLVVAALGLASLLILRAYYATQERAYLESSAEVISQGVTYFMQENTSADLISAQLQNFAFLSQVRIRLMDMDNNVLSDTGPWKGMQVSMVAAAPFEMALPQFKVTTSRADSIIVVKKGSDVAVSSIPALPVEKQGNMVVFSPSSLDETIYGIRVGDALDVTTNTVAVRESDVRSQETVRRTLVGADGQPMANLELSEGPAYGQEIVTNVANSLWIAAVLAVLVAVVAGWWTSRWIIGPLAMLTGAAHRMSQGDLSVRVDAAGRSDEFGALGRSFNQMADSLQATIQSLQRFVADAAHQIQTPITALRMDLELAGGETTSVALQRSQTQVIRLQNMVDELLKLSRFEAGLPGGPQWIDLSGLLRQIGETYAGRAEQNEQTLQVEIDADVRIRADEYGLSQTVENLLDNALKFSGPGRTIKLQLARGDKAVTLSVEDDGPGVAADERDQIFERFYRGRQASMVAGSGLGLAIVRIVVEQHGGKVWVQDSPNGGACFVISLPLKDGEITQ